MSRPKFLAASPGFGSAWLIFGLVMAIFFGVLAWPKIREASQKAKIDTVASLVRTYRLACLSYYSRKGTYPLDGQEGITDDRGQWIQMQNGRVLNPAETTFGDILIHEGYLSEITFPLAAGSGAPAIRSLSAEVLVRRLGKGILFASAPTATRVVVLTVPGLPMASARGLEEIFRKDRGPGGSQGSSAETPSSEEVVGDCRSVPSQNGQQAEAFIYLAHE